MIEEFLTGAECSIHALVDGHSYLLLPTAQDHKQLYDGNQGPNTGGMGTFSPSEKLNATLLQEIREKILDPFMCGIRNDKISFRGLLFPGLMLTNEGPRVLEFNCRFGDPETQVLLPRLKTDIVDLFEATIDQRLNVVTAEWDTRAAVCIVMASGGYPNHYETGKRIVGLEQAEQIDGVTVFHAGNAAARRPDCHLRGPCPGRHRNRRYVIGREAARIRRGRENRIRRKLFPPRHWFDLALNDLSQ